MKRPRSAPLYLAREGYRRRRLMDAARMLPIAAAFLMALPVLWAPTEAAERDTALNTVYLFALWLVLIVVAFVLSRGLSRGIASDASAPAPVTPDDPASGAPAAGLSATRPVRPQPPADGTPVP